MSKAIKDFEKKYGDIMDEVKNGKTVYHVHGHYTTRSESPEGAIEKFKATLANLK